MRELVPQHAGVVAGVDVAEVQRVGPRVLHEVHLHPRRLAVGRRPHVRVVDVRGVRPAVALGVRAVVGVELDGIVAAAAADLEAAPVVGEEDLVAGEVLGEAAGQIEGLRAVLVAVGQPGVTISGVPRARPCRVHAAGVQRRDRRVERREGIDEVRAGAVGDVLAGADLVVVVDVRPRARVQAVEHGGAGLQAVVLEIDGLRRAGAGVVRIDEGAGDVLDEVLAQEDRATGRIDDGGVHGVGGRAVDDVPGEARARGGAEEDQAGVVAGREARHVARAVGARLDADRALDADVALQALERLARAELRVGRGDGEAVARRAGDRDDAPGAVDRHAHVVVEGGDTGIDLAEMHERHAALRARLAVDGELAEVGRVEAERSAVGAEVVARDRDAVTAAGFGQRAVGAQQLARGAGQRVDRQHALSAELAAQLGAGSIRALGRAGGGDGRVRASGLVALGAARVEVGLGAGRMLRRLPRGRDGRQHEQRAQDDRKAPSPDLSCETLIPQHCATSRFVRGRSLLPSGQGEITPRGAAWQAARAECNCMRN